LTQATSTPLIAFAVQTGVQPESSLENEKSNAISGGPGRKLNGDQPSLCILLEAK
jgi:hypothetical protein